MNKLSVQSTSSNHFALAVICLVASSMLSSIGWVFEGEAILRLSPVPVICVSSLVGGIALLALALKTAPIPKKEIIRRDARDFIAFSIFRSTICSLLFGYCLTMTSSSKVMFLTKMEPYVVLLIQVLFYRHRTSIFHLMLLAVHIFGAVILSTSGRFDFSEGVRGDLLLCVAIMFHAVTYGPAQRFSRDLGALWTSGLSQIIGGVVLIPIVLLYFGDNFSSDPSHLKGWGYVFATIVVFYVLSTWLWFFSLKEVAAWLASALRSVGPLVAAPIAWYWFDKPLTPIQIFGALIIVSTSAWMVVLEKRKKYEIS